MDKEQTRQLKLVAGVCGLAIFGIIAATSLLTLVAFASLSVGLFCLWPTLNTKVIPKIKPQTKQQKIELLEKKLKKLKGEKD